MGRRERDRKYPFRRSISPTSLSTSSTGASLSMWFLQNVHVRTPWHLGHLKPVLQGDYAIRGNRGEQHPLFDSIDMTSVTDLQTTIIEVLGTHGGSCSFETLYETVSSRWQSLRRTDQIPYHMKIRTALENALKTNGQKHRLFESGPEEGSWHFATTLTENKEAKPRKLSEDSDDDDSSDCDNTPERVLPSDLTQLQALIIYIIMVQGGSALAEVVCEHVSPKWGLLRKRDGTPYAQDCRRAVMSSLTNSSNTNPIFLRDPSDSYRWSITETARYLMPRVRDLLAGILVDSEVEKMSEYSRKGSREDIFDGNGSDIDGMFEPDESLSEIRQQAIDADLTDLQMLIIRTMAEYDVHSPVAVVPFDFIHQKVLPHWAKLRRRNGTKYAHDCKRVCRATMKNNPAVPIFKRVSKEKNTWQLGKGALEKLALLSSSSQTKGAVITTGLLSQDFTQAKQMLSGDEDDDDSDGTFSKRRKL